MWQQILGVNESGEADEANDEGGHGEGPEPGPRPGPARPTEPDGPPDPGVYTAPTGTVHHRRRNCSKPAGSSLRGARLGCNRGRWRQQLPAGTPRWAQIARMQ